MSCYAANFLGVWEAQKTPWHAANSEIFEEVWEVVYCIGPKLVSIDGWLCLVKPDQIDRWSLNILQTRQKIVVVDPEGYVWSSSTSFTAFLLQETTDMEYNRSCY